MSRVLNDVPSRKAEGKLLEENVLQLTGGLSLRWTVLNIYTLLLIVDVRRNQDAHFKHSIEFNLLGSSRRHVIQLLV